MLNLPNWITIIGMTLLIVVLIPYAVRRRKTMDRPEKVTVLFIVSVALFTIAATLHSKVFS